MMTIPGFGELPLFSFPFILHFSLRLNGAFSCFKCTFSPPPQNVTFSSWIIHLPFFMNYAYKHAETGNFHLVILKRKKKLMLQWAIQMHFWIFKEANILSTCKSKYWSAQQFYFHQVTCSMMNYPAEHYYVLTRSSKQFSCWLNWIKKCREDEEVFTTTNHHHYLPIHASKFCWSHYIAFSITR